MNELIGRNDNITELDEYKPTAAEEKILETLLNPEYTGKNSTEKMSIAGVCRETWYKALRKPEFVALLNKTSVDLIKEKVSEVITASVKSATTEGSKGFQDRKMLLEMAGLYTQKQDIALTTDDPIKAQVVTMPTEQIIEKMKQFAQDYPEIIEIIKKTE